MLAVKPSSIPSMLISSFLLYASATTGAVFAVPDSTMDVSTDPLMDTFVKANPDTVPENAILGDCCQLSGVGCEPIWLNRAFPIFV